MDTLDLYKNQLGRPDAVISKKKDKYFKCKEITFCKRTKKWLPFVYNKLTKKHFYIGRFTIEQEAFDYRQNFLKTHHSFQIQ